MRENFCIKDLGIINIQQFVGNHLKSLFFTSTIFLFPSCWLFPLLCFLLINGLWKIPSLSITITTLSSLPLKLLIPFTFISSLRHRRCNHRPSSSTTIPPPLLRRQEAAPRSRRWLRSLAIMQASGIVERRSTLSTPLCAPSFPPLIKW